MDVDEFFYLRVIPILNTLPDYVAKAPTFDVLNCYNYYYKSYIYTIHCIILMQVRLYNCE